MTKKRTLTDRIMMREYIGAKGELAKKLHQLDGIAFLGRYLSQDKFIKVNDKGYIRYDLESTPVRIKVGDIYQSQKAEQLSLDIFQLSKAKLKQLDVTHCLGDKNGIYQRVQIEILGEDLRQIQGQVFFYEISDLNDFAIV